MAIELRNDSPSASLRRATHEIPGCLRLPRPESAQPRLDARMVMYLDLPPISRFGGSIRLPGSKSISNRTLLLAALAEGTTRVADLLDADDVQHMLAALRVLGVRIDRRGEESVFDVHGVRGNFPVKQATLFLGNAGTAFRPLTAALAF